LGEGTRGGVDDHDGKGWVSALMSTG
jgi:hypothetical protein